MSLAVAGTTIVLYDYWSTGTGLVRHYLAEQVTGPKGDFSFDVRKGIYSLEVVPNKDTRFARQSFDTIKVSTNTTQTINLKHGCIYSGTVRTASGDIVPNCQLQFFCLEPEALTACDSARDNGAFEITLPKGKYYVACKHTPISDNDGKKSGKQAFVCSTLNIVELWKDVRQDLVLPEQVAFRGVVTNAEGHPVQGVRVTISPSAAIELAFNPELQGICFTDKAGHFECLVEPGIYDVKLEPGPDSHLSERRVGSIPVDQARTRTYSLGQGYRLYGQITFEGEPVINALVSVSGGKIDSSVLTDDQGWYSFSLSGGRYEITVTAQPDSLARLPFRLLAPHTCSMNLAEDTELDIALLQGVMISGRVVDKLDRPRPGAELALYQDKGAPINTTASTQRALAFGITGDDGSYEFRVLPGNYWLIVNNQQATAKQLEAGNEDLQHDLSWQTGCLVSFAVVSELDEPIPHCAVFYEQYGDNGQHPEEAPHVRAGDDGICNIVMEAGIYAFRFDPPEQGSFQGKQIRQLSINSDIRRKIRLGLKEVN
jgi:hypothetical protein